MLATPLPAEDECIRYIGPAGSPGSPASRPAVSTHAVLAQAPSWAELQLHWRCTSLAQLVELPCRFRLGEASGEVDGQVGAHHALLAADLVEGAGHHRSGTLLGQVVLHLLARRHRLARLASDGHQWTRGQNPCWKMSIFKNGRILNQDFLQQCLSLFPGSMSLAFAYGSGVFTQKNNTKSDRMVDFIFAVDDPQGWHEANIAKNPRHYSFLKYLGSGTVSSWQKDYGAKVYFNTLVPVENGTIKYGVISTAALLSDLLDWDTLYVSGRLHKPCRILLPPTSDDLATALRLNLQSALHTALLLLPSHFTERELYTKIAGLSYTGDFRMWVGEDKNKVSNIVDGHLTEFAELYAPARDSLAEYMEVVDGAGRQDVSPAARFYHLSMLPRELQTCVTRRWNRDGRHRDVEDVLRAAAYDLYSNGVIVGGLGDIARVRNISQSVKGIVTAGLVKSIRYSARKLGKMFRSMRR